jgi:hypothetical protein
MRRPPRRNSFRRLLRVALVFSLFQRGLRPEDASDELSQADDEDPRFARIRCPRCRWRPNSWSLWHCGDCWHPEGFLEGCGAEWNTFDTRGLCPGCGHQWRWTSCLSCEEWSPHEDWYAGDAG